jgi:valyl-tRNA synthetase
MFHIDKFKQIDTLNKELEQLYKLWDSTNSKLDNVNFIRKSPKEIQEKELQKWNDSLTTILVIENQIRKLLDS